MNNPEDNKSKEEEKKKPAGEMDDKAQSQTSEEAI